MPSSAPSLQLAREGCVSVAISRRQKQNTGLYCLHSEVLLKNMRQDVRLLSDVPADLEMLQWPLMYIYMHRHRHGHSHSHKQADIISATDTRATSFGRAGVGQDLPMLFELMQAHFSFHFAYKLDVESKPSRLGFITFGVKEFVGGIESSLVWLGF